MKYEDVTDKFDFQNPDDEYLPVTKCICGQKYVPWEFMLGIYPDDPCICGTCQRKFYFRQAIKIIEVIEDSQ